MTLDGTAREANFRDSVKKFFVDNISTTEGIALSFDITLATPFLGDKTLERWVNVDFGPMERSTMSTAYLEVRCATRRDNEGFKLAQLTDKVIGYLTATTGSEYAYIPFYRSHPTNPWVKIGGILIHSLIESGQLLAEDRTKYKLINVELKFASKI
jgi:hypothetical protein